MSSTALSSSLNSRITPRERDGSVCESERERVGVKVMWVLDGVVGGNDTIPAITCHRTTASTL